MRNWKSWNKNKTLNVSVYSADFRVWLKRVCRLLAHNNLKKKTVLAQAFGNSYVKQHTMYCHWEVNSTPVKARLSMQCHSVKGKQWHFYFWIN